MYLIKCSYTFYFCIFTISGIKLFTYVGTSVAEILGLCDKRRKLRKKKFEPEGSEKYKDVNNSIKRCMKKTKENWIGEQCSEIKENLKKKNSKRAYQLVKDLTTVSVKQGKATTVQDCP